MFVTVFFYSIRNCPCLPLEECSWFQDVLKLPGSPTKREFIIFAKERLCNEDRKHLECCDPSGKTPTIEKDVDLISEEIDHTDRVKISKSYSGFLFQTRVRRLRRMPQFSPVMILQYFLWKFIKEFVNQMALAILSHTVRAPLIRNRS